MARRPSVTEQPGKRLRVPLGPRALWRLLIGGAAALAIGAVVTGLLVARVPAKMALGLANAASRAGFTVRQVNIEGLRHQPRLPVYSAVLEGGSDALMLIDLGAARARLMALPWVADASVHRSWPDTLDVRIRERTPAAIWQYQGDLALIDDAGTMLPAASLQEWRALPVIVGANAATDFTALRHILAAAPVLEKDLRAATRIGGRRWDLLMESGETISLPEDRNARAALVKFAQLMEKQPLLGQGFVRFDLRIPGKMAVRVSREAGAKAKAARAAPDNDNAPRPMARPVPQSAGVAV